MLYSILQKEELKLRGIDDRRSSKDATSRVKKNLKLKKEEKEQTKGKFEGIDNRKDVTFYPFKKRSTDRRSQQL